MDMRFWKRKRPTGDSTVAEERELTDREFFISAMGNPHFIIGEPVLSPVFSDEDAKRVAERALLAEKRHIERATGDKIDYFAPGIEGGEAVYIPEEAAEMFASIRGQRVADAAKNVGNQALRNTDA